MPGGVAHESQVTYFAAQYQGSLRKIYRLQALPVAPQQQAVAGVVAALGRLDAKEVAGQQHIGTAVGVNVGYLDGVAGGDARPALPAACMLR